MAGEENDFVVKNKVLAYSPLAYPGETVSFEFRAPKKVITGIFVRTLDIATRCRDGFT